jgi:hypothetical protein
MNTQENSTPQPIGKAHGKNIYPIASIDGATLQSQPLRPIRFVVKGLLAQGAYILAGPPKKGKSWMALQICLSVATGEPLWNLPTVQGDALYLCLEDNLNRIQNRLFDFTDNAPENIHFATLVDGIGCGLEEQVSDFVKQYPQTNLVVIDTLQKVRRPITDNAYASDYDDTGAVKSLADSLGLCILLVHHTRKQFDADPMNMISGTTGMPGAADGYLVMQNRKGDEYASLHCSGRDIESRELKLSFDTKSHRWDVHGDSVTEPEKFMDNLFTVLCAYLSVNNSFMGTATGLANALQAYASETIPPAALSKKLLQSATELEQIGIHYTTHRSSGRRISILQRAGDGNDGSDGTEDISKTPFLPSLPTLEP